MEIPDLRKYLKDKCDIDQNSIKEIQICQVGNSNLQALYAPDRPNTHTIKVTERYNSISSSQFESTENGVSNKTMQVVRSHVIINSENN